MPKIRQSGYLNVFYLFCSLPYIMERAMKELFESMVLNRKKCPWAKGLDMKMQAAELETEVRELRQGIEANDTENIREELGDVFWDAVFIGVLAEEKGLFTMREMLEKANSKFKRRKPWVFGNEKVASAEAAVKRWYEIKKLEKEGKFK